MFFFASLGFFQRKFGMQKQCHTSELQGDHINQIGVFERHIKIASLLQMFSQFTKNMPINKVEAFNYFFQNPLWNKKKFLFM